MTTEIPEDGKPWWESRTIIGALITVIASLAAMGGWAIDVPIATDLSLALAALVGGALSWWGRVRAERPISRTQVLPGLSLPPRAP